MVPPLRVAACHASPIFLSAARTTEKAISLITQASKNKANLVVFPETYIPAFPIWSALRPPTDNHALFQSMAKQSVYVDGDEVRSIREAAKQTGTMVSVGISEKVRHSSACLFNSNLFIDANGEILVHHRKLVPTFFEKLTWSPGDGHGLRVADTKFGKIGALICGENTNPLARYSLMAQGEQVHISTWPAIWPTRAPKTVGNPSGTGSEQQSNRNTTLSSVARGKNYDNVAANRTRAAAHCFEAKCFGVICAGHLGEDTISALTDGVADPDALSQTVQASSRAVTMFLDTTGALLPGFTVDPQTGAQEVVDYLQKEEGILYTDMNMDDCIEGKQYHDVVGGYQRMDVFDLKVDRSRRPPITFVGEQGEQNQKDKDWDEEQVKTIT